jgi:hypothetical protein
MDIKDFFEMQRKYESTFLEQKDISTELKTQQLALCAHAEISDLLKHTNLRSHHKHKHFSTMETQNTIKYEAVDVVRYMIAIMNQWDISAEDFSNAYDRKDTYLRMRGEIDNKKYHNQPVVIVDLDDVIVDFRKYFAKWLEERWNLKIDVNSEEYYFITDLTRTGLNPEDVFEKFTEEGGFCSPDIKSGAYRYLWDLKNRGYWIQYLTARPKDDVQCVYDTYSWIEKHSLPYDGIDFSSEKFRWCAKSKLYSNIEFAIDDSPKHAQEYAMHGIRCLVPEMPYNKQICGINNIERCKLF